MKPTKRKPRKEALSGAVIRATLSWNGAVLESSHDLDERTALFAQDAVAELHLTYEPRLLSGGQTEMLSAAVLLPANRRLRFRLAKSETKADRLHLVLHR